MEDWSEATETWLKSPLGKELLRSLEEDLHASLIEDAESAKNADAAYGLLKEASGVKKALEHLKFRGITTKS